MHAEQQELRCLTLNEARELNVVLRESEGVNGRLQPAGELDLFCHSKSEPASFDCYQFDVASGSFRPIGGWIT